MHDQENSIQGGYCDRYVVTESILGVDVLNHSQDKDCDRHITAHAVQRRGLGCKLIRICRSHDCVSFIINKIEFYFFFRVFIFSVLT